MSALTAKFREIFLNLKPDAVPRPPRGRPVNPDPVTNEENNGNDSINEEEPEGIVIEELDDDLKKDEYKKPKQTAKKPSVFKKAKAKEAKPKSQNEETNNGSTVNIQATGNVTNIQNSTNVHLGHIYKISSAMPTSKMTMNNEEEVVKCKLITSLMKATDKPIQHEYLDFVSNNLGKDWHSLFIELGFLKGRIETMEINTRDYGVTEARYKLLLDWTNNEQDGSLGKLAETLWDHGDRALVKQLAIKYNQNKNK